MKKHRPMPPRTQHRPGRSRTSGAQAPHLPLHEYLPRLLRGCTIGLTVAVGAALAASAVAAAVLSSLPDPNATLPGVSAAILLLCALLCGLIVGRLGDGRWLLGGWFGGMLLLLAMLLLAALPATESARLAPSWIWALRAAVPIFCCFGAYIGGHIPTRSKRRR